MRGQRSPKFQPIIATLSFRKFCTCAKHWNISRISNEWKGKFLSLKLLHYLENLIKLIKSGSIYKCCMKKRSVCLLLPFKIGRIDKSTSKMSFKNKLCTFILHPRKWVSNVKRRFMFSLSSSNQPKTFS